MHPSSISHRRIDISLYRLVLVSSEPLYSYNDIMQGNAVQARQKKIIVDIGTYRLSYSNMTGRIFFHEYIYVARVLSLEM